MVAVEVEGCGSIGVARYGTAGGDLVICSFGTNIGGSISSSDGGCGCQGTATVVRAFLAFCGTCSDNMGNKESKVGIFSLNDGINLSKVSHCRGSEGSLSFIPDEKNAYDYGAQASGYQKS